MKLARRFPNFVDADPSEKLPVEITTIDELNNLDYVKHIWLADPRFHRLSYSRTPSWGREILMAELDAGVAWYAIAYVMEGSLADLGLPEWVSPNV